MKKFFGNLVYLLMAMPLGIVYFTLLTVGFSLGAGLTITLIGIPLLVSMIFVTYMLGDLERAITSILLGVKIVKPEARPARNNSASAILTAQLKNAAFWKEFAYLLILKLPLGIISFTLVIVFVTVPLALMATPVLVAYFPSVDIMIYPNIYVNTMTTAMICFAVGLGGGFLSIFIINALGAGYGKVAAWALGRAESQSAAEAVTTASS
ncbi:MAG: sensor domain-containing protein [Chloroflexi bacterium]|nr:sensor domain-containing protein [Chloroflexota bacterium]